MEWYVANACIYILGKTLSFLGKAALTVVVGSACTQPNISAVVLGPDLVSLRSFPHHLQSGF